MLSGGTQWINHTLFNYGTLFEATVLLIMRLQKLTLRACAASHFQWPSGRKKRKEEKVNIGVIPQPLETCFSFRNTYCSFHHLVFPDVLTQHYLAITLFALFPCPFPHSRPDSARPAADTECPLPPPDVLKKAPALDRRLCHLESISCRESSLPLPESLARHFCMAAACH